MRAKLSSKHQIVVPRDVRERLHLAPGDELQFRLTDAGVTLEKAPSEDDPFAAFHEWSSAADDEAYADL
jgi:antitoxin PrlF